MESVQAQAATAPAETKAKSSEQPLSKAEVEMTPDSSSDNNDGKTETEAASEATNIGASIIGKCKGNNDPTSASSTTTEATEERQKTDDDNGRVTAVETETPTAATPSSQEEPRKKRRYNKGLVNDDGLSGSYWQSPAKVLEETATGASSRPRRSNAGSRMKTALLEIDRKKKGSSPEKANTSKTTTPTPTKGRKSAAKDGEQEQKTPGPGFRVQPYEKPVTRGRGRPRKAQTVSGDEVEDSDSEFEPAEKKSRPKSQQREEKPTLSPTKSPIRTYGRRATVGTPEDVSPPTLKPQQSLVRTYTGRRHSAKSQELVDTVDGDSDSATESNEARVSPSTALIAALSIPDELLPTSHEKFLDKFRETQEKSPTPPERRVHNLDEVVATYKSSASGRASKSASAGPVIIVVESEQNTPAESSESEEGDSESAGSSPSDDKENLGSESTPSISIVAGAAGSAAAAAASSKGSVTDDAGRSIKWGEDEKPTVIKLGPDQLSINDQIVNIDYTNYVRESDVEVPFDYDVVFEPEPKLEDDALAPKDSAPSVTTLVPPSATSASVSNPPSPNSKTTTAEAHVEDVECELEACKKGCVCQSIKRPPPRAEHCGRPKCFLECSCLFNKDHVLIKGDEKNIRSRLRPRVTLLNWKDITKNGGSEQPDERGGDGSHSGGKKHKKDRGSKGKKGHRHHAQAREAEKIRLKTKGGDTKTAGTRPARGQGQGQVPPQQQVQVGYKPGPKSSKPLYIQMQTSGKGSPVKTRSGGDIAVGLFKVPKRQRPPPLISTRYASNLPILRRIYSCQPCHVQLTKMPKKWSHWSTVESKCAASGATTARRAALAQAQRDRNDAGAGSVPFHVATSNFKLSAHGDLSYTIVRPNGSILALLYWEAHTKEAPRSIHPHAGGTGTGSASEVSYPWLYLPLPSSGKVWLFYEIPKYPNDLPAIYLPELGVFLPTNKLMLMTFEANQTGRTSKLYFESKDESKMTEQGLLNFVYLVPNLPSLIVYGPVPKTCLKTVTRRSMEATLRAFEESDECKHLRKKLAKAGTDVEEVGAEAPWTKYAPEYEDDFVRDADLIDESIWEQHYEEYMIPANGYEEDELLEDNGYGAEYDFGAGEEIYTDYDDDDEGQDDREEDAGVDVEVAAEVDDVREAGGDRILGEGDEEFGEEDEDDGELEEIWEEVQDQDEAYMEDESEFQEQEEITLMNE